jgi:hypothetical protein
MEKYKHQAANVKMKFTNEVENHSFLTNSFFPPYYDATRFLGLKVAL